MGEVNYSEYGYLGTEQVVMDAMSFAKLRGVVDAFLEKETNAVFPQKYMYVNEKTGDVIKTLNEKNKPFAKKIVDVEATMNSEPVVQRTREGVELLSIHLMMNEIHKNMVDSGVAKHKSVFEKMSQERNVFEENQKDEPLGETKEGAEV